MRGVRLCSLVVALVLSVGSTAVAAVPDLLYYKLEEAPSGPVVNSAVPGVGTNPAPLSTMTIGAGGQFDNGLIGTGTAGGVATGWATNLGTGSWTISLWLNNLPSSTGLNYLFGDSGAGSFRSFVGGAAGAGNLYLRRTGMTDVLVTGVAPGPVVLHFVYDSAVPEVRVYRNGVFDHSVAQAAQNITGGTGFTVGTYATSAGLSGTMDEFRLYGRALTAAEITETWNVTLYPPAAISAYAGSRQATFPGTPFPISLSALVVDTFGDPVAYQLVTFTAPASGASGAFPSGSTALTDAAGIASVPFTANLIWGGYLVTADVTPSLGAPAEFELVNAGPCFIDGAYYLAGAANPTNECESCDPAISQTSWTDRVAGFPCADDGLACTADVCDSAGACVHPLATGCLIDAACVAAGAADPTNECAWCRPEVAADAWSSKPQGVACTDDGLAYTMDVCDGAGACVHPNQGTCVIESVTYGGGAPNPANECEACDPEVSQTAWTSRVAGFPCTEDALDCTTDACDGAGVCAHVLTAGCLIGGACVAAGTASPTNGCASCRPETSTSAYSNQPAGIACTDDGLAYTRDVCDGAGACTHPNTGACVIGGTTYFGGAADPTNECQACDPAVSQTAWTGRVAGSPCADDGLGYTGDVCDGDGACTHPALGSCVVGGTSYAAGAANPANACQACAPNTSQTAWSNRVEGYPCPDDGLATTLDVCDAGGVCTHPETGTCVIGGTSYVGGAANPENACQQCSPDVSQSAWTDRVAGYPCADDGLACTADVCDGAGACEHPLAMGCFIGGACVDAGAAAGGDACLVCDPVASTTAYSASTTAACTAVPADDSGCSCRAAGSTAPGGALLLGLLLLGLVTSRRRR